MPQSPAYYPSLVRLISIDDIPEAFDFIRQSLQENLSKIYFKDLQISVSPAGDLAFYGLRIISKERIDCELIFGLKLILNRDFDDEGISSFPVSLQYSWPILGLVRAFSLDSYSFSPQDSFELGLRVFNISELDVLTYALGNYVIPQPGNTVENQFVDDINLNLSSFLSSPVPYPTSEDMDSELCVALAERLPFPPSSGIFLVYMLDPTDLNVTENNVNLLFSTLGENDYKSVISNLLIPKSRLALELMASIEFPRGILVPWTVVDGVLQRDNNPDHKSYFDFARAVLYADTQEGIGYQFELAGTLNPAYSEIGNTGLLIQIESLKLDLSKKTNIPEADLDGRDADFIGVYARAISVTFPPQWFHDDTQQSGTTTTLRLGGYNLLIGTGGISGTIMLESVPIAIPGVPFNYYNDKFTFNYPIVVFEKNEQTQEIIEHTIDDYQELNSFLQQFNASSSLPYPFKFPLSLTPIGSSNTLVFQDAPSYQQYLSGLNDNTLWKRIGNESGFQVGFTSFDITFKQNVVVASNIVGKLKIPKLKDSEGNNAEIIVSGHLNEAGDFNLTAAEPEGIPLTLFNFVTINFLTLELGREDDHFYIGTQCQIWFENQVMARLIGDQMIEIPRLRIYDNGTMEIVGGNGFIPLNISLSLGPIDMAVTGVHFGSTQLNHNGQMRKYNYWGFDGAISIDPLGVDVRGNGIKYYYTVDNDQHGGSGDSFIHIKTLEIDLVIPGTASPSTAIAIIHGMLSLPDPGESPEYIGEISLKLPKAKIAGSAAMKLAPRYPAFVVDAFIDLPAPIPIGPLGIYGFRGLLGFRYVAEKEAIGLVSGVDTWYDYFVYPPKGIHVSKFSGPERTADYTAPFSVGAGAVLGTSFDSGTVISVRAMLLLSLPTLFAVEGKASILSARLGLDDNREPPFFAYVYWGDNSIEMGMGANYKLPSSNGWILKINANVQAGFFFNSPSTWYVNFGTRENPISADILTIVTAQTYLMLSAQGIEAGARQHFDINKRFGPARVHLYAYLEIGGFISFERPQLGGYIAAGGGIDVDIWIVSINLSLHAIFSAEAAKPFLLYAEVSFRVCVKLGFFKVCRPFTVKLKWEKNSTVDRAPVAPLPFSTTQGAIDRTNELVKGIHMLTNQAFDLNYLGMSGPPTVGQITKVIPLDTFIEFKTVKGLSPGSISGKIGGYTFAPGNHVDLIPPQKVVHGGRELRQVKHKYSIEDIEIKAHNGNSWVNYHPFEAVVSASERPGVSGLRLGYWQIKEKQYDTIRILATTPFTYLEAGEPGWHIPELYGITPSTLYCQESLRTEECANVLNKALGTVYYPPDQYIGNFINGAYFTLLYVPVVEVSGNGEVSTDQSQYSEVTNVANVHGFAQSLTFKNDNGLVIILPDASVTVKLRLSTDALGVTIRYYRSIINDNTSIVQYELIHEEYKTASQLNNVIEYVNEDKPVTKIVIKPDGADLEAIDEINEQIAALFEMTYDEASGEVNITEPSDIIKYQELVRKKEELESKGCSQITGDCRKDAKLCDFYEYMLGIFNDCFIYPVNKIDELLREQSCFNDFRKQLDIFDQDNPQYRLIESMIALYEQFVKSLEKLNHYLDSYPDSGSDREIIESYYQFREYTIAVLEHIKKRGDCDCDDNPRMRCTTSLQQVCWLTLENHEYNMSIPGSEAIAEDFEDMTAALEQVAQPVWRPNTSYYIRFRLKDEVDNGDSSPGTFDYYYGFKTVGPLGHYHKNPAAGYLPPGTNADEYPLTSLRSYIDYGRSYPNADGNLLKAKPLFYGHAQCKISVYFDKPSTYHMFQLWHEYNNMPELEGKLHIAIKDPVTDVIVPYPLPADYHEDTVPVPDGGNEWHDDNDPLLPPHIQLLNNIIEYAQLPCQINLGDPIVPASSFYSVTLTNLKPLKLYTALLYNAFEVTNNNIVSEPVHEFVFQTSRYPDFASQVNSYVIIDEQAETEQQAVYPLELDLDSVSIDKAWGIISNPAGQSADPLGIKYQHLFDRIIEGVFEIIPMDPPERTEFVKLTNKNTGDIVALLIKNPEPFNNPKIPLENLGAMIAVVTGSGSADSAYKALYSKDYSQALIMNTAKKITAPTLNFRFKYYTWNGSAYQETDNILVQNININQ